MRLKILLMAMMLTTAFPAAAQPPCGDALPPRLLPGFPATVLFTDGSPLNVRADASRTGAILDKIPEGDTFEVSDFGQCNAADGIIWYPVLYSDVYGWIAESVGGEYLVAPLNAVRLSDTLPQDALLAVQLSASEYALVNREMSPLTVIVAPLNSPFPTLESGEEAIVRGGALFVYTVDADFFPAVAAFRAEGDPVIYRQPARPGRLVGYMPSPDGARVAWLFDLTTVPPTFNGCDAAQGCVGRVYALVISGADGAESSLVEWTVGDPYPFIQLQNWIDGRIILERHMWGVASGFYPIMGGGLIAVDETTGSQIELTPLTDLDELLSPDGSLIARADNGATLVSVTDARTGEAIWSLPRTRDFAGGLSFSPDGQYLTYGVFVWDSQSADIRAVNLSTGETRVLIAFDAEESQAFPSVGAWLSDLAAAIAHSGAVSVFEVSTGSGVYVDLVYAALGDEGRPVAAFTGRVR